MVILVATLFHCVESRSRPLRDLGDDIMTAKATDMRPINYDDFINAKNVVYSSVSADAVHIFVQFNKEYGGGGVIAWKNKFR